ncbi:hypothetical protein BH09VER1_BH09VER1_33030 [soil metagenome]
MPLRSLVLIACLVLGTTRAPAEEIPYGPPIVITKGGTYRGNWKSTNDDIPAVKIETAEPVIIENSQITGTGDLIFGRGQIADLTVRNTSFHGLAPVDPSHLRGCGINVSQGYRNLLVEHNFFENTSVAIKTYEYSGDGTPKNSLVIRFNRVRNIDGRRAVGKHEIVQFVAVQNYRQPIGNPAGGEIAWNEVINEPGKSCSEDLINFFKAGGRKESWFKVHDNYLHGSYPPHVLTDLSTGSGMIVDGPDNNKAAYIESYRNIVVNTTNAGMNIAAGSHIWYHDNRIISTGKTADGKWLAGSHGGVGIFDFYKDDKEYVGTMHDIVVENNVVGWAKEGYDSPYPNRNDNPANLNGAYKSSNVSLPNAPITQAMQDEEYKTFLQRVAEAGVVIGPISPPAAGTPSISTR